MTSKMILDVQAVHFSEGKPSVFTSGWPSPVHIDCRKLISYPRVRSALIDFATATIVRDVGFEQFDTVAGGETAGIPYAAWIADRLALPMQYVRKKPKGFGRGAQIEGHIEEGARTLLVEDLTTDGRSKVNFCKALRDAGAVVDHVFVMFYYDIFPESKRIIAEIGVKLLHLATWWDVLRVVKGGGHFEPRVIDEVERFLHAPAKWSAEHGGVSAFPES
jgi:orotate phosphoribosyltransferase